MIKDAVKNLGKVLIILCGGIILGTVLLTVSFLFPTNQKNLEESRALLDKEAWYPAVPELGAGMYFQTFLPGVLDNSSDCIMLYTAMDDSEGSALYRAMDMYSDYSGKYSYYWHGYVSILRPLSLFFNYGEIRIINGFLQLLFILILVHFLWNAKGRAYGMLVLSSYLLLMPVALGFSLQYSWVFYITMTASMLLVIKKDFWEKNQRKLFLFLVIGMLTSYFDLLTYPLFTWGVPLILSIIVSTEKKSTMKWLKEVVCTGLMWIIGYAVMWAAKWYLATGILDRDIVKLAMDEVFLRAGVEDQAVWNTRWSAMTVNWKHYDYKIYMLIIFSWLIYYVCKSIIRWGRSDTRYASLLLISVSPFVWYGVLANHTKIHHLFTYRIWGISILAVFSGFILATEGEKKVFHWKGMLQRCVVWACVGIVTVLLLFLSKEETFIHNGECDSRRILLENGVTLKTEFMPENADITQINICISTESIQGSYKIRLWHDDEILDERDIPMEKVKDNSFFPIDVDWCLKTDEVYLISITPQGGDADSFVVATLVEETLMPEFGYQFVVGETEESGQIIAGVNYRYYKFPTGKTLVFKWMTWCLVCFMLFIPVWGRFSRRWKANKRLTN